MSENIVLPALGERVTEGTVTRWLKNVGDEVAVDEPRLEVSTDKVDTEIPSPVAGVLEEILVDEDETAEVGAVLARVGDGSGASAEDNGGSAAAEKPAPVEESAPAEPAEESASTEAPSGEQPAPTSSGGASSDAQDITLPALGESVTEGTVTRWLKDVGDDVAVDEPLLEVSTDKVDTEVPSPVAGTLQEILVEADETAEVGAVLARVGSGQPAAQASSAETPAAPAAQDEVAPEPEPAPAPVAEEPARATPQASQPPVPEEPATVASPQSAPAPATDAPSADASSSEPGGYVTPIVRKLARDLNVDLNTVTGTGTGGRIRKEDVEAAAAQGRSAASDDSASAQPAREVEVSPLRGTTVKMSRLRRVISERAVESQQETAQLTTVVEVDVTRVASFRDANKDAFLAKTGTKLSFLPFFALAAAEALRAYPIINSTVDGTNIVYPETENLSIAVDTERGLLTPVLRDAGDKNLAEIALEIADLAQRTRDNQLKPDELSGGTFTLTNTGSRGALFDTPLVFLPQTAILGTGVVVKRPAVVSGPDGDAIAIRSTVYLAISYDHRIIDGADAARFLTQVKTRLEEGNFEADLGI